mgnify:CR=1 FL=1
MRYPGTVLMLVAVLPAATRSRVPFKFEVSIVVVDKLGGSRLDNAYGYGASVYTSSALSRRDPLNAVATSFVVEF